MEEGKDGIERILPYEHDDHIDYPPRPKSEDILMAQSLIALPQLVGRFIPSPATVRKMGALP